MKLTPLLLVAAILPGSLSCSHESKAAPEPAPAANSTAPPVAAPPGSVAAPAAAAGAGLAFTAQEGWVVEKPTSAMRKAQYRLPHSESDTEDASLVVYFFGGQGGDLQSNLDRWCGQFQQPDGKPSSDVLKKSSRTVNGMNVHEADLSGTYVAETAPGSGEHVRKEGWRMLAAILEAKDGPYYAKLVGPSATVGKWEESFRAFVNAAKPAP
jgi:hypothetical protein